MLRVCFSCLCYVFIAFRYHWQCLDSQRTAGQGKAKTQQNPALGFGIGFAFGDVLRTNV